MIKFPWRKRAIENPKRLSWLSVKDCRIVGQIVGMTDGEVTYLTDLYVEPDHRGEGRGVDLIRLFLKGAGDTTIILLTNGAEEFYKKFGFEPRIAMVRKPIP